MFGKIKNLFVKKNLIIVILIALVLVGWFFAIYFGLKLNRAGELSSTNCLEKLDRVRAYGLILDQSNKLARAKKSFDGMEEEISALNNGPLFDQWQNVVLGGNRQQDLNDYFDTIIDSITFFSK